MAIATRVRVSQTRNKLAPEALPWAPPNQASKIVHVVEAFGGGVLQSVAQLCWATWEEFEHHIVYGQRSELPDDFADRFPPGTDFSFWGAGREISFSNDVAALKELYKLLRHLRPDLVHAHSAKAGVHARLAAGALGLPCVYSPRGYAFLRKDVSAFCRGFFRGIEWGLGRLPAWTVACGRDELAEAKKVTRRTTMITNMIDPGSLPAVAATRSPQRFTAVMSGRIAPQKNFPFFLEVARRLQGQPIDFLWVGGANETLPNLPDNVTVTGWLSRSDALEHIAGASVYLQTALWEGLPLAVLEAMALGLPVVTLATPGSGELVEEGCNGYVIRDADGAAKRLCELADDGPLRVRMGERSIYLFHTRYSARVVGAAWSEFYQARVRQTSANLSPLPVRSWNGQRLQTRTQHSGDSS